MIMNDEVEDNSLGEITITTEIMVFFLNSYWLPCCEIYLIISLLNIGSTTKGFENPPNPPFILVNTCTLLSEFAFEVRDLFFFGVILSRNLVSQRLR